ncbi:MAG: hypothetical protein KatS3mg002_0134 [Candidatus Woesearchaeota archaeon]|nr:MAG: hypothetical protein KatS3mg002_0134 [Candidatus Woesearchaeota archaeon]
MVEPVKNGLKLLVELDGLVGSNDWIEHSYEYMCCGREYFMDEDKILEKYGYQRETAPFIVRVHNVDYGIGGVDFWQVAYIVRPAILDKDFDMESFIEGNHPFYDTLTNGTYHPLRGRLGSRSWVIGQEEKTNQN